MARISLMGTTLASVLVVGLTLLAVADAKKTIPTECPKWDEGNVTVQIAHETDCTKYYSCVGSKKVERDCPIMDDEGNRLYFNPELQVCDWPFNVDCKLPPPVAKILSSAADLRYPTECPKVDPENETIQLPHETDCTKYYMCSHGKKILMLCGLLNDQGDRLYFNPVIHGCDWPENVDCVQPQPSVRISTFVKKCPVLTECPKKDSPDCTVHLPHETDCTKFYKCFQGQKYVMDCPVTNDGAKLNFNSTLQVCDWPWVTDCIPGPNPPITPSTPRTPPTPPITNPTTPSTPRTPPTPPITNPTTPSTPRTPPTPPITNPTTPSTPRTPPTPPITNPTTPSTPRTPPTPPITNPTTPSTPRTPPTPPITNPTTPSTPPPPSEQGCMGTCPNNDPPNKITALPNIDCRKWCRCERSKVKVYTCPADFYFSPTLKVCTKPELSGCKGHKYPHRSQETSEHDEALMNILGYNESFLW